jgi:hypothetical protein
MFLDFFQEFLTWTKCIKHRTSSDVYYSLDP